MSDNTPKEKDIMGKIPSVGSLNLIKDCHELIKNSSKTLDEASKNLIILNTTLVTIYSISFSYFGNLTKMNLNPYYYLLFVPLVVFFVSIWFNLNVHSPKMFIIRCDRPSEVKKTIENLNLEKYKNFQKGKNFFIFALILVVICLICASIATSLTQERYIRIIVKEENLPLFQNMSIPFEQNSLATTPVLLTNQLDNFYRIKLINGTEIDVQKDLVSGLIYLK